MSFVGWMTLAGALLLVMALAPTLLRRLPLSSSIVYMTAGFLVGPVGFEWMHLNLAGSAKWLERLTEVAVIVSLFMGGLKLRLPVTNHAWRAAFRLAGPVMLACILGVAAIAHFTLGLDLGLALLLGAVLAPTDPVLASSVAVNDASDHDRMRYGLSAEAGLNDGMAFPFVVLALMWHQHSGGGAWIGGWFLHRVLWAIPAGLLCGYVLGRMVARLAIWLRSRHRETSAPTDFLALALIALSYVAADAFHAWGFLAVFAAGVGLRHAEVAAQQTRSNAHPHRDHVLHPPAETIVSANTKAEELDDPAVAAGVIVGETLSFGSTAERLLEVLIVAIVGLGLSVHWDWRAVPLGAALFLVIRPLSAWLLLAGTPTTRTQRALLGWFGIRGIGSLYYLAYAQTHGLIGVRASVAVSLTVSVVAMSVVAHGITAHPVLRWYHARLQRKS